MFLHELLEAGATQDDREEYAQQVVTNLSGYEKAFEQYKDQIAIALDGVMHGVTLWRGVPSDKQMMLVDPTTVERKAANTHNFINIIQSTSPEWKAFPPRNRSMICTTNQDTAKAYSRGSPYIVLPFGDPVIGLVPGYDFWEAFHTTAQTDVYSFNLALNNLYIALRQRYVSPGDEKSLSNTKEGFFAEMDWMDKIIKTHKADVVELISKDRTITNIIKALVSSSKGTLLSRVQKLFNPRENGFEAVKLSEFKARRQQEVWVSAPAILIKDSLLTRLTA